MPIDMAALAGLRQAASASNYSPTDNPWVDRQRLKINTGQDILGPTDLELLKAQLTPGVGTFGGGPSVDGSGQNTPSATLSRDYLSGSMDQAQRRQLALGSIASQQKIAEEVAPQEVIGRYGIQRENVAQQGARDVAGIQSQGLQGVENTRAQAQRDVTGLQTAGKLQEIGAQGQQDADIFGRMAALNTGPGMKSIVAPHGGGSLTFNTPPSAAIPSNLLLALEAAKNKVAQADQSWDFSGSAHQMANAEVKNALDAIYAHTPDFADIKSLAEGMHAAAAPTETTDMMMQKALQQNPGMTQEQQNVLRTHLHLLRGR